jgi:OOP family OmpA-OmpF porin
MKKFPSFYALVAATILTVASGNTWSEVDSPTGSTAPATQTPAPASGAVPGWYPPAHNQSGYARPWQQRPYRPAHRRGYGQRPRYYSPREQYRTAPATPAITPAAAENPLSAELKRTQEQLTAKSRELDMAHAMLEQLRGKLEESLEIERVLTERMALSTREQQARTSELSAALNTASASMERDQQQITDEQAQNQGLTAERDRLRDELAGRDELHATQQAELQAELQVATKALAQAQAGTSTIEEELDAARAQIETLDNELTTLRADLATQQTEQQNVMQNLTEERDQLRSDLAGRDEQLATMQSQAEASTSEEELDAARAQIETLTNELAEANAELETWKTTQQETGVTLAAVKGEREGLQADLDGCSQELAQAEAALTNLQTEMDALDLERLVVIETAAAPASGGAQVMVEPAASAATDAGAEVVALQDAAMDADADGVADSSDLCPGTPLGTAVDSTGCAAGAAIKLEGVNFLYDSHELTNDARRILDRVATVISQHPDLRLQVAGHTDATGDRSYNQWLSMQRAEAVMDYLVAQGVKRTHIGAVGYGGQRPIADNDTLEGLQKNRRVELRRLR